jgi:hypothetical protein
MSSTTTANTSVTAYITNATTSVMFPPPPLPLL